MTLKINNPTLKLKHQGIMAITELKTIDFVVYTQKSLYIQTINFDEEKWGKQYLSELTVFHFEHLKIKIFGEK